MITRAEHCVVACAEAWRGDGEIVASPFGMIPRLGALLARATFSPDLVITDGEAMMLTGDGDVEGWLPFRSVFDIVWAGRRHVMMGASQIDRRGNQNISVIGEHTRPKVQLVGARGGPGNTVNHPTSYWVPNHSARVFVEHVDFVSGVGYAEAARYPEAARFHEVRHVISDLGVFDFPDGVMAVRSLHPGVDPDEVREKTGFELVWPSDVPATRDPTDEELRLIREVLDPEGRRDAEVPP